MKNSALSALYMVRLCSRLNFLFGRMTAHRILSKKMMQEHFHFYQQAPHPPGFLEDVSQRENREIE